MYSKNTFTLLLLISSVTTWSFAALGDAAGDRKIVTSKAYVDTKQVKIPATTNTYTYDETNRPTADGSVVTTGASDGTVGERGIATAPVSDGNGGYSNGDWLPTVDAMMNAISSATPTISGTQNTIANYGANGALGSGIATYDGSGTYAPATDAGKIATAAAVETKQDIIETGLVEFTDGTMLPAFTTYDSTSGLVANKIGILDQETIADDEGYLSVYSNNGGGYGSEMDNFVPTVRAVAESLQNIWDGLLWTPLYWSNTQSNAINGYNTTFGNDTNNWAGSGTDLINGQFLANSLALKQNKLAAKASNARAQAITRGSTTGDTSSAYITAGGSVGLTTSSGAPAVINYVNGTVATTEDMTTFTTGTFGSSNTTNQNYIKNALVSLELLKDVYSELNSKITNNALPTGTTGTVATYNGVTNGVQQFTETAIYDTANAYNATNDANKLATAGFVATKQDKIPAKANGDPTKIVTYPAYGSAAGAIGELSVDTSTLNTTDNTSVPSSKLVSTSLAGKQNQIPAGNALFLDNEDTENDLYLPGLVAYDSTTQSLKGDQIGILSYGNMQDWQLDNILTLLDYPLIADKAVPTVGSVAASLANLVNSIENAFVQKQNVLSPQLTATTGKTDLVPAGGETIAFDPESDELSSRYITGAGTEGLTTKTGADSVIGYVNGTVTLDGMQISNFGALFPGDGSQVQKNKNYIKKALVSLETLKDVYSDLNTKITANSRPTGTTGTVATYNGVTNGVQQFTGTPIYSGPTSQTPYNATNDANKLATAGFVETKQNKIGATSDGTNNTPNYVYDSSTNPNAAGSVVTTTTTAGTTGQVGIATAPVSDGNGGYSNGDWLPTVDAMMNAISSATPTISGTQNTIANYGANGALGSGIATYDGSGTYAPATDAGKIATAAAVETKQDKIIAGTAGNVVTYTGTAGSVGSATVSSAATYTNDTLQNGNDIANITAVETKQDKIVASDILLLEEDGDAIQNDIYTPSIVTHDSNDETLVGTQFGILSNSVIDDADIGWEPPYLYDFEDRDDLVPTVAALMPMFNELWDGIDNVYNNKQDILTKQLYTTIFNPTTNLTPVGGETIDIQGDNTNSSVGRRYITGGGSQALTTKSGADTVLSYVNGTKSLSEFQTSNFGASGKLSADVIKNNTYIRGALVSLDLLRDTYAELDSKISDAVSAIDFDTLTWDSSETAAANAYSTTFSDSGTNTWPESDEDMVVNGGALANALSLKQNKVTTGLVELESVLGNSTVNVPALVATNAAGTELSGNTIGIARRTDIPTGNISAYAYYKHDNFVPSLRLMASELSSHTRRIYDSTAGDTVVTLTKVMAAVNTYSNIFSDSGTNTWPSVTQNQLVNGETLAWTLVMKQNKIGATSDGTNNTPNYVYNATTNPTADGSVVTTTTTQGVVSERGIATAPVSDGNGGYSNGDWLPTVDAMMNAISSATPTISGTQNTIANYGANGALGSGIATYDGSGTYAPATDAGKIATAAAVETKQDKIIAGTAGNVVTYTGTAGSVGSATVSSAATYTNDTLQNGNDIANITAVETKVSKTQSTGYQVLTTGTNGTVTTEYISVPVTTSGTGRPTSSNAPTGTAAIWIE